LVGLKKFIWKFLALLMMLARIVELVWLS